MAQKNVGYAYPFSLIALHKGYNKMGCWFVSIDEGAAFEVENVIFASESKMEVLEYADKRKEVYGTYSQHTEGNK
ncbi:MAG: hypothetical protein ACXW1D_00405 [Halobacteriota archaeon]